MIDIVVFGIPVLLGLAGHVARYTTVSAFAARSHPSFLTRCMARVHRCQRVYRGRRPFA